MEPFSYVNIFETKGIEYMVIIAFLILLIPFSLILNRTVRNKRMTKDLKGSLSHHLGRFPQGLFFSRHHTWAFLQKSGVASIGLDDMLLHLTGDVTIHNLLSPGQSVSRGDAIAEIHQNGKQLRIHSPVSGSLLKTNQILEKDPDILQQDPFGNGWLCRIRPTNWKAEMNDCFIADEANEWIRHEVDRFRDFLAITLHKHNPVTPIIILQDGGEICNEAMCQLPAECWQEFQQEFLDPVYPDVNAVSRN